MAVTVQLVHPQGAVLAPGLPFDQAPAQVLQAAQSLLTWPYDALRWWYAAGVQAGWVPRSMLAARDFERAVGAAERQALGLLARHV